MDNYLLFLDELTRWNKAYNLTSIDEPAQVLTRHILDSLSILPFLRGKRCLDVGSGAGFPGMILALARPEIHWTLLDSNTKKVRFLRHVQLLIKPVHVEIVRERVEKYQPQQAFTSIVSRALTSLGEYYRLTRHLHHSGCRLLAMKGKFPREELSGSETGWTINKIQIPGQESERHLAILD